MIKSPIFYMGNKEKLIRKGLIELFPKDINTFIEPFCGSAVVSLNVKANTKIINDIDENIINLIKYFRTYTPKEIVSNIESSIQKYNMPTFSTDARKFKGDREIYKIAYNLLRDEYNKSKYIELLYILNIFSNSHMLRYNSKNEFNMPFGNGYFTEECKLNILNNTYNNIDIILNTDYLELINYDFKDNDFIYLDPPYSNTTATYNENCAWTKEDDINLFDFCDKLNKKGIRFALSNIFENKGVVNKHLIEWCKNKYNINYFGDFTYCSCGKGNSKTIEVLITNY